MVSTALAGPDGAAARLAERSVDSQANAALSAWLRDYPPAARELEEAMRARIHHRELDERAQAARACAADAERRSASETVKLDPGGQRVIHPVAGSVLVAALVVLNAWLLYWGAQAFGLSLAGRWLVTGILLAASTAVIAALEASGEHRRRRLMLGAGVVIAGLALVALRTGFRIATGGVVDALLRSVIFTSISACLILSGSMVLSRTCLPRMARAQAAARRSRRDAYARHAASAAAAERMQRHLGALRQLLIPWALSAAAPASVDHVNWTTALNRAVRGLLAEL